MVNKPRCARCKREGRGIFPLNIRPEEYVWLCSSCLYKQEYPHAGKLSLRFPRRSPRERSVPVQEEQLFGEDDP